MASHTSAKLRKETSTQHKHTQREQMHGERTRQQILDEEQTHVIDASLKRRARTLITNGSIPRQTRSLIQYALDRRDRHLGQMVRRVEAGELTIDHVQLE